MKGNCQLPKLNSTNPSTDEGLSRETVKQSVEQSNRHGERIAVRGDRETD